MESQYLRIQVINTLDEAPTAEKLCKLFEEVGELAKGVNKTIGRKITDETPEEIRDNVLEEAADSIQCIFSILGDYNITYQELSMRLNAKNDKWVQLISKKKG
tara:strand:+ start:17190 stop:17498 length:309 start_codon:yes stop_codon:yes gene_type:complete